MWLGWIRRAARAVGYVLSLVIPLAGLGSEAAHAETARRPAAEDRLESASDVWQGVRHPVWLRSESATEPPVLVYPPLETEKPAPLVVLLHGMCDHPENECPWFAGAPTSTRYLVCPQADLSCSGGGAIWSGATRKRVAQVEAMRDRMGRAYGDHVGPGATLIGFSLGAFVALDVAQASHGEWPRLLLVGAFVKPNAKKLKAAGVESVLFASGDWDMSKDEMKKQARALRAQGVRARYMGMGPVGHWFAKDMDTWLASAFDWMESESEN